MINSDNEAFGYTELSEAALKQASQESGEWAHNLKVTTNDPTQYKIDIPTPEILKHPSLSYAEGSSFEFARQAAAKLPFNDSVMNQAVLDYKIESDEPCFIQLSDGTYVYQMFKLDLKEENKRVLDEFRAWVAESGRQIPLGYSDEHNYDYRYLLQNKFDKELAYNAIVENDRWLREDLIPLFESYEEVLPLLEKGYVYGHGRDKFMRPQIVINARKIIDDDAQLDDLVKMQTFFFAYVNLNALVPG